MSDVAQAIFRWKVRLARARAIRFARELSHNQQLTRDQLEELNLKRRQELVRFASIEIPLYREKYRAAGFEAGDEQQEGFFEQLPVLEKEEIRLRPDDILHPACRYDDLIESTTGGSTGVPLKTYQDPNFPLEVISWRTLNWWHVDISDSSGYLYRSVPIGLRKIMQKILLWPSRRNWLAALDMTTENMTRFQMALNRDSVRYLVGYVGALDAFAQHLLRHDQHIDGLRAIWTTSAPLPEGKRKFLESIYHCPVYTQYGSCEFYWVSAECEKQEGLHISSDVRHVDVVEGDQSVPAEQFGDLLVTDLINRKFPLIRYRLGDRGRLLSQPCSCPLPFPRMDYVKGRITDSIRTAVGAVIPGEFWTTIFDSYTDVVRSFQVYQSSDLAITVRYETNEGADSEAAIAKVRAQLTKKLGHGTPIEFVQTKVEVNDNGKTRFVISEVSQ
jgi:phenylacetate-CoA ligase